MVHHHFPVEHMPSGSIQIYTDVHGTLAYQHSKEMGRGGISNFPEATTSAPETRTPWYQEITFSFSARPYLLQTRDHKCTWMRPWRSHSYHPSFEFQIIPTCSWIFCEVAVVKHSFYMQTCQTWSASACSWCLQWGPSSSSLRTLATCQPS